MPSLKGRSGARIQESGSASSGSTVATRFQPLLGDVLQSQPMQPVQRECWFKMRAHSVVTGDGNLSSGEEQLFLLSHVDITGQVGGGPGHMFYVCCMCVDAVVHMCYVKMCIGVGGSPALFRCSPDTCLLAILF